MDWPGCLKGPFWAEIGIKRAHCVSSLYTPWNVLKNRSNEIHTNEIRIRREPFVQAKSVPGKSVTLLTQSQIDFWKHHINHNKLLLSGSNVFFLQTTKFAEQVKENKPAVDEVELFLRLGL
jgi:hypothetical protein